MVPDLVARWGEIGMSGRRGAGAPPSEPEPSGPSATGDEADLEATTRAVDATAARAFIEGLFARHHSEIYAYLVRMVRDSELAADLAQDAFVRAYRAYGTLDDPAKARAWLYQIANRVALDDIRRRRIIRFVPWTGESHGAAASPEKLAMDARLSPELARALARIPERQRSALLLAEVHEMTGVELAAALGTSHVAARALLTRARDSLRRMLAEERAAAAEASRRRPEPGTSTLEVGAGRDSRHGPEDRS